MCGGGSGVVSSVYGWGGGSVGGGGVCLRMVEFTFDYLDAMLCDAMRCDATLILRRCAACLSVTHHHLLHTLTHSLLTQPPSSTA